MSSQVIIRASRGGWLLPGLRSSNKAVLVPTQGDPRTLAGVVAAAGAVVAKQVPLRNPPPADLPPQLRPSTPADLPRLFSRHGESPGQRVARLSAAALLYSVNKASTEQPSQLLFGNERRVLDDLHEARHGLLKTDRSCPHCRLLYDTLYNSNRYETGRYVAGPEPPPPIAVVSHSARVKITFDPDTNISEARINNFQLIVPSPVATEMLRLSHPLRWAEPAGTLFRRCVPVNAKGVQTQALRGSPEQVRDAWERQDRQYIYEDCAWPINDDLDAVSENIIAFDHFFNDDSSLSYTYRLERSLRSNFGVAWERSGLDIDSGFYQALAVPVRDFSKRIKGPRNGVEKKRADDEDAIPRQPLDAIPIGHLQRRDLLELLACHNRNVLRNLYSGSLVAGYAQASARNGSQGVTPREMQAAIGAGVVFPQRQSAENEDATTREEVVDTVETVAARLEQEWGLDFSVVNVSASKRLHFTVPDNSPIELWHLLTLTAPAFLFAFLNTAICLAPHTLVGNLMTRRSPEGFAHA